MKKANAGLHELSYASTRLIAKPFSQYWAKNLFYCFSGVAGFTASGAEVLAVVVVGVEVIA